MSSYTPSVRIIPDTNCSSSHPSCPAPITVPLIPYNIPSTSPINATFSSTGPDNITIRAPWDTDLWNKPKDPYSVAHNQPFLYTEVFLREFHSARVKVSSDWIERYDQGGIVLIFVPEKNPDTDIAILTEEGNASPTTTTAEKEEKVAVEPTWQKWIKSGIEFEYSRPNVGTVATANWSDWSLLPLPLTQTSATIELARSIVTSPSGEEVREASLWVYVIDEETGEKTGIREITWVFEDDVSVEGRGKPLNEGGKLWVGVYACRPALEGENKVPLDVKLEGFEIRLFNKPREV